MTEGALAPLGYRASHFGLIIGLSVDLCPLVPIDSDVVQLQSFSKGLSGVFGLAAINVFGFSFGINGI